MRRGQLSYLRGRSREERPCGKEPEEEPHPAGAQREVGVEWVVPGPSLGLPLPAVGAGAVSVSEAKGSSSTCT